MRQDAEKPTLCFACVMSIQERVAMALRATHEDESRARVGGAGGHACAGSPDPAPQLDFRVSGLDTF